MSHHLVSKQKGLTLVELMIAVTLGVFITGSIIQLFINSKQSYRVQENLSRLQENARFAISFLNHDIRMAGNMGCVASTRILTNTLNDTSSFNYNFSSAIQGFESTGADTWSPALDASITAPLTGHDVLTVRGVLGQGVDITGQPTNSTDCDTDVKAVVAQTANLKISNTASFASDDIVIAANCDNAVIFQISQLSSGSEVIHAEGVNPAPGNASTDLGACYAGKGELFKLISRTYYIRTNPSGIHSLYRKDGVSSAEELVEGIEDMQVLYGEDTDNDHTPNYYVSANSSALNMDNVVSIRISLLATTIDDNLATVAVPYTIFGNSTTPTDHRIRRVFTTTIALRNRLP